MAGKGGWRRGRPDGLVVAAADDVAAVYGVHACERKTSRRIHDTASARVRVRVRVRLRVRVRVRVRVRLRVRVQVCLCVCFPLTQTVDLRADSVCLERIL
jgi:endonuclease YncB( thermonuclease family)